VLFDTGQDRASVTDPSYFPSGLTGLLYDRLARFDIGPDQTLTRQLDALGHDIADVHTAVLSHLHQDHIGGLPELSHANIMVSDQEWSCMQKPMAGPRGFLRDHIELDGRRWNRVHPEALGDPALAPFNAGNDLFGDGSLVALPTPGHTPGSMSLMVRRRGQHPATAVPGPDRVRGPRPGRGRPPGHVSRRGADASMRPAEGLRYLILAIQREGNRLLAAELRPLGVTPSQAEVLRLLSGYEPLTLTALGDLLVCETGNSPSRLVDRLVAHRLVKRDVDPADRRYITLVLTPEGKGISRRIAKVEERIYSTIDEHVANQPVGETLHTLRSLASAFPPGHAVARRRDRNVYPPGGHVSG
jgi:glyoxylase-like metal-dependent hydrolase (beta-lactamase superfamily II)/DNA-binding MarR family transcriptional regulator